ncbi:MAG: AI-2E family transporter [Bacteroidetes bacterium]|nr:AI-2E family transporter [Bacteroidota bacterium]
MSNFNNRIRQIVFLMIVLAMAILLFGELYLFFPGFLGALTLFILSRSWYYFLTEQKSWNKSATALLFITVFLVAIATPVYFSIQLLYQKVNAILQQPEKIESGINAISKQIEEWTGEDVKLQDFTGDIQSRVTSFIPKFLNSSATMLGNLLMGLFLAYFIFKNGRKIEAWCMEHLPLREKNVDQLSQETDKMVKANALGIPLISIIQGIFALAGYWVIGIDDFVVLGLVTGIFAFFPVIGTAAIWLPVVIYLFSVNEAGKAIGLGIYSLVVTGNVDYLARITFLQKIGHVHPIITIFGIIVGLRLFGILGFIFGPLLVSYFILLLKIYKSEFGQSS